MDFAISIAQDGSGQGEMTFGPPATNTSNLLNNIWLSCMLPQGAFFYDPAFGNKAWTRRLKGSAASVQTIHDDFQACLQWLLDVGKASSVDVQAALSVQDATRIDVFVTVTAPTGEAVTFSTYVGVV